MLRMRHLEDAQQTGSMQNANLQPTVCQKSLSFNAVCVCFAYPMSLDLTKGLFQYQFMCFTTPLSMQILCLSRVTLEKRNAQ